MSNTVKTVALVVVIVVCLAFAVYQMRGSGSGGGGAGAKGERDLFCLDCKKVSKAVLDDRAFAPLIMAGVSSSSDRVVCPACGKKAAVAAIQCQACKEWVPSPGMQGMGRLGPNGKPLMSGPPCAKCGKPLVMPRLGSDAPAQP